MGFIIIFDDYRLLEILGSTYDLEFVIIKIVVVTDVLENINHKRFLIVIGLPENIIIIRKF